MPYVRIELLAGRTEAQKAAIAQAVVAAIETHAGARPEATIVVFQDVEPVNWSSGGVLHSQRTKQAAPAPTPGTPQAPAAGS